MIFEEQSRAQQTLLFLIDFFYVSYKSFENHQDSWEVPTEILYGEKDNVIYIENIADFLANHSNARLTIKQGAEHYMHTEEEKEFIKNWILKSLY